MIDCVSPYRVFASLRCFLFDFNFFLGSFLRVFRFKSGKHGLDSCFLFLRLFVDEKLAEVFVAIIEHVIVEIEETFVLDFNREFLRVVELNGSKVNILQRQNGILAEHRVHFHINRNRLCMH